MLSSSLSETFCASPQLIKERQIIQEKQEEEYKKKSSDPEKFRQNLNKKGSCLSTKQSTQMGFIPDKKLLEQKKTDQQQPHEQTRKMVLKSERKLKIYRKTSRYFLCRLWGFRSRSYKGGRNLLLGLDQLPRSL